MAIHSIFLKLKWLILRLWGVEESAPSAPADKKLRKSARAEMMRYRMHRLTHHASHHGGSGAEVVDR